MLEGVAGDAGLVRAATYSRVSTQQQAEEGFNLA